MPMRTRSPPLAPNKGTSVQPERPSCHCGNLGTRLGFVSVSSCRKGGKAWSDRGDSVPDSGSVAVRTVQMTFGSRGNAHTSKYLLFVLNKSTSPSRVRSPSLQPNNVRCSRHVRTPSTAVRGKPVTLAVFEGSDVRMSLNWHHVLNVVTPHREMHAKLYKEVQRMNSLRMNT